jgi:hypothetical protein
VQATLQGVVNAARLLPGGKDLELEENDLANLAEQELLNCATQIEARSSACLSRAISR